MYSPSKLLDKILRGRKHDSDETGRDVETPPARRTDVRLAFLYQREQEMEGAPLLRFELLGAYWFRRILQGYQYSFTNGGLQSSLLRSMGRRVQPGLARLPERLRQELYEVHLRYVTRMLQAADPAPVALAELIADTALLSPEYVREGDWYIVEHFDRGRLNLPRQPAVGREMVYATISLSSDRDGPSRRASVARIVPLAVEDPALHVLLQALHYPQIDPRAGPDSPAIPSRAPRIGVNWRGELVVKADRYEMRLPSSRYSVEPRLSPRQLAMVSSLGARGGTVKRVMPSLPSRREAAIAPSFSSPVPLPFNPMTCIRGYSEPFVAVNMIGAGNNVALYGREGIVAFVDFGLPLPSNKNTMPPAVTDPCVCGDPLMILSHWDYDHYAMARKNPHAWRRRWIAPQQVMGSVAARELYVRLLVAAPEGGALALWPDGAGGTPTHWPVSFGFIERGTGAPVNDDCLAVHVRLQDDAAITPAPDALLSTFASRISPSSSPSPALGRAIIVDTGLMAVWIDDAVDARFSKSSVVIPVSAGLFVVPSSPPMAGANVSLTATDAAVAGPFRARWIPPGGLALPKHAGAFYVPVLPNGQAWQGGWAISASDFVRLGGCIVDFPTDAAGHTVDNIMCISPTPGTVWEPPNTPRLAPASASWLTPAKSGGWKPVWGGSYWAIPLPAAHAAALAPLPSGPVAISPVLGSAPVSVQESYVLLPGDAGYQYLPSLQARLAAVGSGKTTQSFVGMLATHHGSASWIPKIAADAVKANSHIPPASTAKIIYSYGTRIGGAKPGAHCYDGGKDGHPQAAAIAAYLAAGWGMPTVPAAFAFNRLNTAPYDFASKQPFNPLALAPGMKPKVANSLGHYNGDVAVGLNTVAGKLAVRPCPHCGQVRRYYF